MQSLIESPQKMIDSFVNAGSDMITLHIETIRAATFRYYASLLKKKNIKVGVSLNPSTSIEKINIVLDVVDLVLVMSVNPGFAGQKFISDALLRIKKIRSIFSGDISVDGGINEKNAKLAVEAGANVLVAGSYIFGSENYRNAIRRLKCVK